jgi:hypothetical protein
LFPVWSSFTQALTKKVNNIVTSELLVMNGIKYHFIVAILAMTQVYSHTMVVTFIRKTKAGCISKPKITKPPLGTIDFESNNL